MKLIITLLLSLSASAFSADLYNFDLEKSSGEKISFKDTKGKAVLIVNIATRCGYTGQLDGIEKLYKKYGKKGLVIIGVPSNDFGGQSPESNEEIVKFCRAKFGASFPISKKTIVKGENKHALYKYLVGTSGGKEVEWNFTKFLFGKDGKLVKRFSSYVAPEDKSFIKVIESTL